MKFLTFGLSIAPTSTYQAVDVSTLMFMLMVGLYMLSRHIQPRTH